MNWIERISYILQPTKLKKTKRALNYAHKEIFIQCSINSDGSQLYNPDDYLNNSSIEFSIFKGFYLKTTNDKLFCIDSKDKKQKNQAVYTQNRNIEKKPLNRNRKPIFLGLDSVYYDSMALSARNNDEFYDAMIAKVRSKDMTL